MTYGQFLVFFLAPLLIMVAAMLAARVRFGRSLGAELRKAGLVLTVLVVAAVLFTTPWDSWLIRNSVWWYPRGSVLGVLVGVPYEEYMFMIGQTLITGCWTLFTLSGKPIRDSGQQQPWRRPVFAAGWLLLALTGVLIAYVQPHALYFGAILAWFCPPLALQCATGADVLRNARTQRLRGLAITPVLWAADTIAIHAGAWTIGPAHTVGVSVLGLPLEEGAFFLLTNILIVNSMVLVLHPVMRRRLATWLRNPTVHLAERG